MQKRMIASATMLFPLVLALSASGDDVRLQPALRIRPPTISERVPLADAIVIGKVESIEEKTVSASPPFGGDKVEYRVAVVKITEGIRGAKGLTHVKVAFQVPQNPGGPIRPGVGRFVPPQLAKDQEACLFLAQHPTESFFVFNTQSPIIDQKNQTFEKETTEVKKLAKLLDNADEVLKSKDNEQRVLVAGMLLHRYRMPVFGGQKTEPIDAEQSKLILSALSDADWAKVDPQSFLSNPINLFYRLGLNEKDGWTQPTDGTKIQEEAKKWLKDHADSYRIQRFVAEKGSGK